jgi:hypothetical protein
MVLLGMLFSPCVFDQSKIAAQQHDSSRTLALEKEVKEKDVFIGKLRHEGLRLMAACPLFEVHSPEIVCSCDPQRAPDRSATSPQEGHGREQRRQVSRADPVPVSVL